MNLDFEDGEFEETDTTCPFCHGTGEGDYSDSICTQCNGTGEYREVDLTDQEDLMIDDWINDYE